MNLIDKVKYFLRVKKEILLDGGFILLVGCLSLTWFKGDNLISGGDFGLPFDRLEYFRVMLSSWDEAMSFGLFSNSFQLITYGLWAVITQYLGLSLIHWEKSLFFLWFAGGGLSMYFLTMVFGIKRLGRLIAAVFYMLNPFSLIIIWRVSHGSIQSPYAFAPLFLALFIKAIKEKKGLNYIFLSNLIIFIWATGAYINLRSVAILWIPAIIYLFTTLIFQKKGRIAVLKQFLFFLLFWIVFNFPWIVLQYVSFSRAVIGAEPPALISSIETLRLNSVKILDGIRMLGFWSLHSGYKGEPYYPFESFFRSPLIIFFSWLIPVLVLIGFFHAIIKKKENLSFFIILIIIGIIGMSGHYPPFGKISMWFYQKSSALTVLARFPFLLFGIPTYLAFSVLIGASTEKMVFFLKKTIGQIAFLVPAIFFLIFSVFLVLPFWNGEVIQPVGNIFTGERVKIPNYWWEVKKWSGEQKDFFRILPLPMSKTYNVAYKWEKGYSGADPLRWFVEQPVVNQYAPLTFQVPELIGDLASGQDNFNDIAKLLGYLNVKYLLLREDIKWEILSGHSWWYAQSPEGLKKLISNQKDLSLEKSLGKLSFYKVKDDYLLPHIYSSPKLVLIDGKANSLQDIIGYLRPEGKESFFLTDQNPGINLSKEYFSDFYGWKEPLKIEKEKNNNRFRADYEISVLKDGEYSLFLPLRDILENIDQSDRLLTVFVDGKEQAVKTIGDAEDNPINLGDFELKSGEHKLSITFPEARNLISNPSFEHGLWNTINNTESEPIQISNDAVDGKASVSLSAISQMKAIFSPIGNFRPKGQYYISFLGKYLSGEPGQIVMWENSITSGELYFSRASNLFGSSDPQTSLSSIGKLKSDPGWQSYQFYFKPQDATGMAGIMFLANPSAQAKTVNLFDKVIISRAFVNPILIKRKGTEKIVEVPEINYKKVSQTEYEVHVTNATMPFLLIFSEGYHPGWKIPFDNDTHFIANGFANGWYISKLGTYDFKINFAPQKIFTASIVISSILVFSSGLFFLINYLKHRKKAIKPS